MVCEIRLPIDHDWKPQSTARIEVEVPWTRPDVCCIPETRSARMTPVISM